MKSNPQPHEMPFGETRPAGKTKILVVDDDELIRKSAEVLFVANGFEVIVACNGVDALEFAQQMQPEIALVDWMLDPHIKGCDVACQIRDLSPNTRIIIISGIPDIEADLPPDCQFLQKPFGIDELLGLLSD